MIRIPIFTKRSNLTFPHFFSGAAGNRKGIQVSDLSVFYKDKRIIVRRHFHNCFQAERIFLRQWRNILLKIANAPRRIAGFKTGVKGFVGRRGMGSVPRKRPVQKKLAARP